MVESSPPVLASGNVWWQLAGLLQGVIARNCASQGVMHFELLHVVTAAAVAAVTRGGLNHRNKATVIMMNRKCDKFKSKCKITFVQTDFLNNSMLVNIVEVIVHIFI